jgi:hypothetical protein
VLQLASFKFRVKHLQGKENLDADALSRMFDDGPDEPRGWPVRHYCSFCRQFILHSRTSRGRTPFVSPFVIRFRLVKMGQKIFNCTRTCCVLFSQKLEATQVGRPGHIKAYAAWLFPRLCIIGPLSRPKDLSQVCDKLLVA